MKRELDQLFLAGVNHVMFHGTTYSPSTAVWPGWKFYASVDMSPTNSIWRDAPELMKYIERVQSFMQMGQPDNDLLVYAPFVNVMHKNAGSFQNRLLLFDINTLDTKMSDLKKCVDALLAAGYDCDYTSDRYLLTTTYEGGRLRTASGTCYKALVVPVLPVCQMDIANSGIVELSATDADGHPYSALDIDLQPDGSALLAMETSVLEDLIMTAVDVEGEKHFTTLPAYGAYEWIMNIDFTAEEEPGGGWQKLSSKGPLSGFGDTTVDSWYRSKLNGREVTGLYEGLTFSSTASNYYFYYPGFGMNANNDFKVSMVADDGTVAQLSYMVGEGSTLYDSADSLCIFRQCEFGEGSIVLDMPGNKQYSVYRMLSVYRPLSTPSRVEHIGIKPKSSLYYSLQGVSMSKPRKGIYIREGKKVVVK